VAQVIYYRPAEHISLAFRKILIYHGISETEEIMPQVAGRYISDENYEDAQDAARDAEIERQEAEQEDQDEDDAPSAENVTK
jgi:type IV secretory pathway VirB9-like protein